LFKDKFDKLQHQSSIVSLDGFSHIGQIMTRRLNLIIFLWFFHTFMWWIGTSLEELDLDSWVDGKISESFSDSALHSSAMMYYIDACQWISIRHYINIWKFKWCIVV